MKLVTMRVAVAMPDDVKEPSQLAARCVQGDGECGVCFSGEPVIYPCARLERILNCPGVPEDQWLEVAAEYLTETAGLSAEEIRRIEPDVP